MVFQSVAVSNIYKETKDFLILGLTGRTGSGCTTAASKLASVDFDIPLEGYEGLSVNELKKHKIIKKYLDSIRWTPFYKLEVSNIITFHLLVLSDSELKSYLAAFPSLNDCAEQVLQAFSGKFSAVRKSAIECKEHVYKVRSEFVGELYALYFRDLFNVTSFLRRLLEAHIFTGLYQQTGDNIRSSGSACNSSFDPECIFNFPRHINYIIKIAHAHARQNNTQCRIVIDAIRNPYEAFYLKRRYANFYLVSINTENAQRLLSLREFRNLSDAEIVALDKKEYPSKLSAERRFIAQNIQECIENSDIHIHNSKVSEFTHNDLVSQLAWYVALMIHPGLVMPTSLENCMQIAYSAKHSSGCISRQVGAVVTDESYGIKAVGWNSTPQGQTPCLLRNAEDILKGVNSEDYSYYELNDKKFHNALSHKYKDLIVSSKGSGRNLSFCFKSVQNEIEGEKNQVHTRSLHAEENAFLQISKHGGQKLSGGILFTTASPCELCAKKAYQLGVKKIVYIDPYPGIATDHILSVGVGRPELELFRGAVGRAFYQLYQPVMPYKDELELVFDIPKYSDPAKKSRDLLERENAELLEKIRFLEGRLLASGDSGTA
ncbi:hypothetical protein V2K16_26595 [Pseudomonas alliivorans]|uniref:CMP/dCMP-type deaminase domain-containing protein n=1 Tax=Pseudomonas alliivorans TaxID=2810613 RepID=A0ABS4CCF2_9PSED|nr:hypothetical protein [Pseudomonas alliivorans]MBP0943653.1 hypothetical protein [Pseudomonas alliivorans]MBP0948120.1 hypothetical protein [Pseudomonas alliivorans]MEE4326691.1 hypothetical protein [Pseudomonas alliivorans]MEE4336538.1 hypothetical protein [Pseudomonas alliivorans]MEE4368221.1 hypothetical protein [Pseudomonas alliivorans]